MNPTTCPPTYPLRPRNGGPLPKAAPKSGQWIYEAKVNGWRTLVHCPTGAMFNRKGEPLSIAAEFDTVLHLLEDATNDSALEWLDCEAFERRHNLGRGSLVILDAPMAPGTYEERQARIWSGLGETGVLRSWHLLHECPPENSVLSLAYHFTDYGIPRPLEVQSWTLEVGRSLPPCLVETGQFEGEDVDGIWAGWLQMQQVNHALGVELFEGYVAKRAGSLYPLQLRSPDVESPDWIKHRFI